MVCVLIDVGVDVVCLNFSYGDYFVYENNYVNVCCVVDDVGCVVVIFVDLQGLKICFGKFEGGLYEFVKGDIFKIIIEDIIGNKEIFGIMFKGLLNDVKLGDFFLIDDGKVCVEVVEIDGVMVIIWVVVVGVVFNNKGINLFGVVVNVFVLSEKDEEDLCWGLCIGVDLIVLFFVCNVVDVICVYEIMVEEGVKVFVIVKVEKLQVVDVFEEIVDVFDVIMVVCGDFGVELLFEVVLIVQKCVVELVCCNVKLVIVVIQMFEFMINSLVLMCVEILDVVNVVFDGVDVVMLFGEISVGDYLVVVVEIMVCIIELIEEYGFECILLFIMKLCIQGGVIILVVFEVVEFVDVKFLCVFIQLGDLVCCFLCLWLCILMIVFMFELDICCCMVFIWGICFMLVEMVQYIDFMYYQVDDYLLQNGFVEEGDKVVVIFGFFFGIVGLMNDFCVYKVGDVICGVVLIYKVGV